MMHAPIREEVFYAMHNLLDSGYPLMNREFTDIATLTNNNRIELLQHLSSIGWRHGQLLILVEKGNCEQVAREIFNTLRSVESTSLRIDSTANVIAEIYYRN